VKNQPLGRGFNVPPNRHIASTNGDRAGGGGHSSSRAAIGDADADVIGRAPDAAEAAAEVAAGPGEDRED